jgi:hypothetical protein
LLQGRSGACLIVLWSSRLVSTCLKTILFFGLEVGMFFSKILCHRLSFPCYWIFRNHLSMIADETLLQDRDEDFEMH